MEQLENEEIEFQLWEFIDQGCSGPERLRIAGLIARDPAWKQKFDELSALHTGITGSLELEQPSLRFTKDVMDSVAHIKIAPATRRYINLGLIRAIAVFFIGTIVVLMGIAIASARWDVNSPDIFRALNWSNFDAIGHKSFLGPFFNIAMFANVVLALILIDKLLMRRRQGAA